MSIQQFFENPELQKFFLIFARLSGIVVFAPPFLNTRLSLQLKGGLVFFLAIAIFPTVNMGKVTMPDNFIELAFFMFFELAIGFFIGFSVELLFMAFQLAGEFIDRDIGFAMASLVDPQTDITVSILGSLLMNLGLFLFLDLNGHLWLIESYAGSFLHLPLLDYNISTAGLLHHMSGLFLASFKFAIEFSIPIIILMILIYATQAFIQRTIPQLQIFVVGIIFTISVGLISVRILLLHFTTVSEDLIDHFQREIWFMITHLRDG